ncbi:MAG: M48 family metalloprotease [Gammaproteobacteria bacterium]|nr:M48 family metalloprotease [Gammaproteobacteria bacterium]
MRRALPVILLAAFVVSGCAVNPVTGKKELSLISEEQELSIGKQQYSPIRQSQGGDYSVDPRIQTYVNSVGQRLAAVSDRRLPYEFRVLNNSVPNAWALPGGKIAINRGLLTELESEAELAAVLGHEIVHAAAKHGAKGMQRGMLLQGAVLAAAVATREKRYANLAQMGASIGAQLINQKHGRDAERQSDHYGMIYMSRAGYDPQGAVDLQRTFVRLSESRQQDWLSGLFAGHPPSQERVENNARDAAALPKGGEVGRERYRLNITRLVKSKPAYETYEKAQKALSDGDISQAKSLVRKAIAVEPREGHFHSLLGDIELRNKRFSTARRRYDKAISLNGNFFYYYLQRGLVNERLKANSAAQRDLTRSVELLPTADAFNALGNIARAGHQYGTAKQYYAKAARHQSAAGKEAFGALVELDISDNPGKYIKIRTGVNDAGSLIAEISNTTPRDVTGLVLTLQYPDPAGQMRQVNRALQGQLGAGQKERINLGIAVSRAQAGQVRSGIVAARIAP